MKIGAQLYSVHDYTKTLDGFSESLKKVADIGYTSVQVSGTCAYEPEWLAEQLKANGLTCDPVSYTQLFSRGFGWITHAEYYYRYHVIKRNDKRQQNCGYACSLVPEKIFRKRHAANCCI